MPATLPPTWGSVVGRPLQEIVDEEDRVGEGDQRDPLAAMGDMLLAVHAGGRVRVGEHLDLIGRPERR